MIDIRDAGLPRDLADVERLWRELVWNRRSPQ
jgi:hypothetical protein